MTEKEFFETNGQLTPVKDFSALRIQVGFRRAVVSFFVRFRYIKRLWLLREKSIWLILANNYEKIPKGSPSRLLIRPFAKSARMKELLKKSVIRSQKLLTFNI